MTVDSLPSNSLTSSPVETTFESSCTIEPIYTGGLVEGVPSIKDDRSHCLLLLRAGDTFSLRDPLTGSLTAKLNITEEDQETNETLSSSTTVYTMKDSRTLITCNTSNLFELWDLYSGKHLKSWKAHVSPILVMTHHQNSPLLATGSADHGIRIWDSEQAYCTHNFRGVHGAMITCLSFHKNPSIMVLFSGADDGSIAVWDLFENKAIRNMKGGHVSSITALSVSADGKTLLSAGRDKIVNFWNLESNFNNNSSSSKTIATMESIESAGFLPESSNLFYTIGEKCTFRIWNLHNGTCIAQTSAQLASKGHILTSVIPLGKTAYDVNTIDEYHDFSLISSDLLIHTVRYYYSTNKLSFLSTKSSSDDTDCFSHPILIGHHGEVTSLACCSNNVLAIGTNGPEIRLMESPENSPVCRLLRGHIEAVIALDSAPNDSRLLSGSRDHSAILWNISEMKIIQKFHGHTDVVTAVALPHPKSASSSSSYSGKFAHLYDMVFTASSDLTIKLWSVSSGKAKWTIKAHDKDINSLTITPNHRYLVSASQDKTCKVWKVDNGQLIAILKGHRRGIWDVAISPAEQVIATASVDKTIKLWSLASAISASSTLTDNILECTCLRTLEGHSNSVLKVAFINEGKELVSASSDGLLKIWSLRNGECITTIDGHNDRIWAMINTFNHSSTIGMGKIPLVTGDAMGIIKIWKDVTQNRVLEMQKRKDESILLEQNLLNMIHLKNYHNAILLALQLEQPGRLYVLFGGLLEGKPIKEGVQVLKKLFSDVIKEENLSDSYVIKLLEWIRDWNTSLKRAYISQVVLYSLLQTLHSANDSNLLGLINNSSIKTILSQILPYTQKHTEKIDGLLINANLVDFIVGKIKNI